jgi:branched-chain amino acid transport system substrate-binding protein
MKIFHRFGVAGLVVGSVALIAACGSSSHNSSTSTSGASSSASKSPVVIGTSLSLSGDFSADGQAFQKGYELWVQEQNAKGGLLGHPIQLKVLNDASSPAQVVTNYNTLIGADKVPLVFGPFSTLLTAPSARVAERYGYAFIEGAGGAPAVFTEGLNNVFDVSVPVKLNLVTWAQWIAAMPAGQRPKTAAYATVNDPFTFPQIPEAQTILQNAGVKTVYSKIFPMEAADYTPIAGTVAATHADAFVLGSVDVPTVSAFVHTFIQQHYEPKAFIATAGPDQGATFVKAVGTGNENGIFVPNGWYPGFQKADSQAMVNAYIAKYGGNAAGINTDVAEAYSVGQVLAQTVAANNSLDNSKIISYLHSNVTLDSVQGPVKFNSLGENTAGKTLTFQWQSGNPVQTLPSTTPGSKPPTYPKPAWTG